MLVVTKLILSRILSIINYTGCLLSPSLAPLVSYSTWNTVSRSGEMTGLLWAVI